MEIDVGYKNLGERLVVYTLSCAYFVISSSYIYNTKRVREGIECSQIINNSGLENMICLFQLNIDVKKLKDNFYLKIAEIQDEKNGRTT